MDICIVREPALANLHTTTGFLFVIAQAGAAIFPSITGIIATRAGVAVLQPIVLALIVLSGIFWWLIPPLAERKD